MSILIIWKDWEKKIKSNFLKILNKKECSNNYKFIFICFYFCGGNWLFKLLC